MKQRMLRIFLGGLLCLFAGRGAAQIRYSLATDLSVVRQLSNKEQFFAVGQSIIGNFHLPNRQSFYARIMYFNAGSFSNNFVATARQSSTQPQQKTYTVAATRRLLEFSAGWKPYFRGSYNNSSSKWSAYGLAGIGWVLVRSNNTSSTAPDSVVYQNNGPTLGSGTIHRLALDLGVGMERYLSGSIYLYGDLRVPVAVLGSASPLQHSAGSPYPTALIASFGLRVLIGE